MICDECRRSFRMTHAFAVNVIGHLANLRGIKRHFCIKLICIWMRKRELNVSCFSQPTFGGAASGRLQGSAILNATPFKVGRELNKSKTCRIGKVGGPVKYDRSSTFFFCRIKFCPKCIGCAGEFYGPSLIKPEAFKSVRHDIAVPLDRPL